MAGSIKGRGALSNPPGRFDKLTQTLEYDGWYEEEAPNKIETVVMPEPARSIISRNTSPTRPDCLPAIPAVRPA